LFLGKTPKSSSFKGAKDKLFLINSKIEAHFLFEKWGLPIKKEIEQRESIKKKCLKQQQQSQNTFNLFLTDEW
jgi:hypothetical protein